MWKGILSGGSQAGNISQASCPNTNAQYHIPRRSGSVALQPHPPAAEGGGGSGRQDSDHHRSCAGRSVANARRHLVTPRVAGARLLETAAQNHRPAKGEPQKGQAQHATFKVTWKWLKADLKVAWKWFHGRILFCDALFRASDKQTDASPPMRRSRRGPAAADRATRLASTLLRFACFSAAPKRVGESG